MSTSACPLCHVGTDRLCLLQVYTAGGGAANEAWRQMRQDRLGVPIETSAHAEAAYGAALLALQGLNASSKA